MNNKKILITGGAGFVGTNLIRYLLNKTDYKIISVDNYSSGSKKNHIKNTRVKYIKGNTRNSVGKCTILLPKGDYTLYFESDGSHSYRSWNSSAPHDQENYGISVYFVNE